MGSFGLGLTMEKAQLVAVERNRGSIIKAKCSICGVGFAQRYFVDPEEAERQMQKYFSRHVAERHAGDTAEN